MSPSAVSSSLPPHRSRAHVLALVLSLVTLAGCTRPLTPSTEEETVSATFTIRDADLLASSTGGQGRRSAQDVRAQFTLSEVQAIKVSVKDDITKAFLLVNVDLLKASAPDTGWSGTIPSLPKGRPLVFSAAAYSSKTAQPTSLLFSGTTAQTLTSTTTVSIALVPVNDGKEVLLPRISRIAIPSAFVSNQSNNISFVVEGANGATLNYTVKAASTDGSGGTFTPASGSLVLSATAGTFVSRYAPPQVDSDTTFEHSVTVTNAAGHSVTTTFKTNVKPPGSVDSVSNTQVAVLFNPVINALNGRRVGSTSDVVFTADVSDDSPESKLVYKWSFSSTESYTPFPTMDGTTRVGTLRNYTKDVQGTVTVAVKDEQGGTTTLKYNLTLNQFPDNPYIEGDSNGLKSIRAGASHSCALYNSGAVRCWGYNASGQLGYGTSLNYGDSATPLPGNVPFVGKATQLALGANHTCALLDNGYVACWGRNKYGQLGYNTTDDVGDTEAISEYGYVNLGGAATKITAGQNHTCALMATGNVRCWGLNSAGQLGYGDTNNVGDDESPKGDVQVGAPVIDIVAGAYHTCALLNTRAMRCWGSNAFGQLGQGHTTTLGDNETPATVGNVNLSGGEVLQISAGAWHTCALLKTGGVRCWGLNSSGQLGYGDTTTIGDDEALKGDVSLGGKVLQVAAGSDHTCALLESGGIKCWGYGEFGQLGHGAKTNLLAPPSTSLALDGVTTAFQLTAGAYHSCAVLSNGKAICWGLNNAGQLGYGHTRSLGDDEQPGSEGHVKVLPAP